MQSNDFLSVEDEAEIIKAAKREIDMSDFKGSTNSADLTIEIRGQTLLIIPTFPNVIKWNLEMVTMLQQILMVPLWPKLTLLPVNNIQLVDIGGSLSVGRAIALPFQLGYPRRLHFLKLNDATAQYKQEGIVPLNKGVLLELDKLSSILITSPTRSGKSYFLRYLMYFFYGFDSDSIMGVVDPKSSEPFWFAKERNIRSITPIKAESYNDFLGQTIDLLSDATTLIQDRQARMANNYSLEKKLPHRFIIVDEALSLGITGTNNKVIGQIANLLSIIALQGAQSRVHLVSVWQNARIAGLMTQEIRQSANAIFALSQNNSVNSLVFPESNTSDIIIPHDDISQGTGLCKVVGNFNDLIFPFLSPTYDWSD